jgi:hypothetical protein
MGEMEDPNEGKNKGIEDPDDDEEDEEADLDGVTAPGFPGGMWVFVVHEGSPTILGLPKSAI